MAHSGTNQADQMSSSDALKVPLSAIKLGLNPLHVLGTEVDVWLKRLKLFKSLLVNKLVGGTFSLLVHLFQI